jgi:chromosome segregation ATPase
MGEFKMKRPTMKDTKEVIITYVKELEEEIKTKQEGKFDPAAEKETVRKKEVAVKAEKLINRSILSSTIEDEYNALKEQIETMTKEIETLTGLTVNVNTFAAVIEANNIELEEMKAAKDELTAEKKAELAQLEDEIKAKKAAWEQENKEYLADLKKTREREVAEYEYKLNRTRSLENDKWEDLKSTKTKELTDWETELEEKEAKCSQIVVEIEDLKEELASVPDQIASIKAAAEKEASDKMAKTLAIKENALKKEVEVDKKLLQQELDSVKSLLAKTEEALSSKESELKAAYVQINEIATKTVQASRPVYLENNSTSK